MKPASLRGVEGACRSYGYTLWVHAFCMFAYATCRYVSPLSKKQYTTWDKYYKAFHKEKEAQLRIQNELDQDRTHNLQNNPPIISIIESENEDGFLSEDNIKHRRLGENTSTQRRAVSDRRSIHRSVSNVIIETNRSSSSNMNVDNIPQMRPTTATNKFLKELLERKQRKMNEEKEKAEGYECPVCRESFKGKVVILPHESVQHQFQTLFYECRIVCLVVCSNQYTCHSSYVYNTLMQV